MDENGIPNAQDIAAVGNAATGFIGAFRRLLPGISMRSLQKAESKTTDLILEDIKKIDAADLSAQTKSVLKNDIIKRHRRVSNLAGVLSHAESEVKTNVNITDVDDNWLEEFQDHAEKISDEDTQIIWGKLLAGEMNSPGSYSKQLMSILSTMSKADADMFVTLSSFCILALYTPSSTAGQGVILLHPDKGKGNTYNHKAFNYDMLSCLSSFGLLDLSGGVQLTFGANQTRSFVVNDDILTIRNKKSEKNDLWFTPLFTPSGAELISLCEPKEQPTLKDILLEKITEEGFECIDIHPHKKGRPRPKKSKRT